MTSFTFSVEQIRTAPPEVRHWIEREIAASLAAIDRPVHEPPREHAATLAACEPEEALQVFELIKDNFLFTQVFFELARELPGGPRAPGLHALGVAEILRHTRLADSDRLVACFTAINEAFQSVRNDPQAALFGFDQHGYVYVHETTHHSIRQVWERLLAASTAAAGAGGSETAGFSPPHLGPSESVARHVSESDR